MKLVILALVCFVALTNAQNICFNPTTRTVNGTSCDSGVNNIGCQYELTCKALNATTSIGMCILPPYIGKPCSVDNDCSGANSGLAMVCANSKCATSFKQGGASCSADSECASLSCVSGACNKLTAGSACTLANGCGDASLFCNNKVCQATVGVGAACGYTGTSTQGQPNIVVCNKGLACVNSTAPLSFGSLPTLVSGVCMSPAALGATCGSASSKSAASNVFAGPYCDTSNTVAVCAPKTSTCTQITYGGSGASCDTANGLQCDSLSGFYCPGTTGTCTTYVGTTCNTLTGIGALPCSGAGVCSCGSDATKTGTCQIPSGLSRACTGRQYQSLMCGQLPGGNYGSSAASLVCGGSNGLRCCARANSNSYYNSPDLDAICSSGSFTQISAVVVIFAIIALLF